MAKPNKPNAGKPKKFFSAEDLLSSTETTVLTIAGEKGLVRYRPPSVKEISDLQAVMADDDKSQDEKNEAMALFVAAHVRGEDGTSQLFTDEQALDLPFSITKTILDAMITSDASSGEASRGTEGGG